MSSYRDFPVVRRFVRFVEEGSQEWRSVRLVNGVLPILASIRSSTAGSSIVSYDSYRIVRMVRIVGTLGDRREPSLCLSKPSQVSLEVCIEGR